MKQKIIFLFLLSVLIGCKKEETTTNNDIDSYCSSTSFNVPISDLHHSFSITEDNNGNTIILGDYQNNTKIIKLDGLGNIIWDREYIGVLNIASKVITLEDNSIIVVSYDENIINSSEVSLTAWYFSGYMGSHDCLISYEYNDVCITTDVIGKTYLTKLNIDGDILWTKEFNESITGGNCLTKDLNGNIILVTMKLKGKQPVYVYDDFGNFQDTVNYPLDENIIKLYKINVDGNIILDKQIENVSSLSYEYVYPSVDMILSGNKIIIKVYNELIFLDETGSEQNRMVIYPNHCNNKISSITNADLNNIIISGNYYVIDTVSYLMNYSYYTQKINHTGVKIWQVDEEMLLSNYNNQKFIGVHHNNIDMYDINGNKLWDIDAEHSYYSYLNCSNGVTFIENVGEMSITRTNENGVVN